ncbi:hypothetical protein D6827_03525 [Candidatus Parcubacteria bacterium]|nr:MAG: hypothetical protein D6827_03525 [Candidatus Parcubacteria bacterium]
MEENKMANALDAYFPEIWAQESLQILRSNMVFGNLVHRDFENIGASVGDTVNTRKPATFVVNDKTAGANVTIQDASATNVPVVLSNHKEVTFLIEDAEATKSIKDLVNEYIEPAATAHAEAIDAAIAAEYANAGATVAVGAAMSADAIVDARKQLNDLKVPFQNRRLVLSSLAEADVLKDQNFVRADVFGDQGTALREASLGRLYGFDIFTDQNIVQTTGTPNIDHNMAFHRNGISLVTRPLKSAASNNVRIATLSFEGFGLRVVTGYNIDRLGAQTTVDILYGIKTLDANLVVSVDTNA